MECPLCLNKIFCLSCYWMENKIIECCCNCAKKYNLIGIYIKSKGSGFEKVLIWPNIK